jgi:transposase
MGVFCRTSQVCSKCIVEQKMDGMLGWHHPKGWLHDACLPEQLSVKSRLHGVRRCENAYCRTVWNRDVNAARNILRVFQHLRQSGWCLTCSDEMEAGCLLLPR